MKRNKEKQKNQEIKANQNKSNKKNQKTSINKIPDTLQHQSHSFTSSTQDHRPHPLCKNEQLQYSAVCYQTSYNFI